MGASVSALHGYNKARGEEAEKKSVAVIGDSTFIHSGITGLIDIAYNQSSSVVIILDNSITGMTGHQQNPTTGYNIKGDPTSAVDLEALCHAVGIKQVRVVDPYDLKMCEQGAERGTGQRGAVCYYQPPSLRAVEICEAQAAAARRPGEVHRLQSVPGHRLSGDQPAGGKAWNRPHPVRGLRRVRCSLCARRGH